MQRLKMSFTLIAASTLAIFLCAAVPSAQESATCIRADSNSLPKRQIFKCGDAFSFEREPNASLRIIERSGNSAPRRIEVEGGAILIEVSPGSAPTQIRTPHAIATVRGTTFVVDAGKNDSSVFVLEGNVSVRRTDNVSTVTLQSGEGVDVSKDTSLLVKSWGAVRIASLLARFAR